VAGQRGARRAGGGRLADPVGDRDHVGQRGAVGRRLQRLGELLVGNRVEDFFLFLDLALVVLPVAQDPELSGLAAVGLEHDARDQLLALLEAESLDVEVRHPDPPRVVIGVLAVVGVDTHRDLLQQDGDLARLSHRPLEG